MIEKNINMLCPVITEQDCEFIGNDDIISSNNINGILVGIVYKYSNEDSGFYVDLGNGRKGFIADSLYEDTDRVFSKSIVSKIGHKLTGYFEGIREDGFVLLNRRRLQVDMKENIKAMAPGTIFNTYVLSISSFGAFVDIGYGIPALLPIGDVSIARFGDIFTTLKTGMPLKVVYCGYNSQGFVVSHKELLGTWDENLKDFVSGDYCLGVIRELKPYGVFIELTPNLTGLADYPNHINRETLKVGLPVNVVFKSKNPEALKVKLSILKISDVDYKTNYKYFIQSGVIKDWVYTPIQSKKIICSSFENNQHVLNV